MERWDDHRWQLRNRVDSLMELDQKLNLTDVERAGVLLAGTKLAMSITPHFFNLIDRDDPDCDSSDRRRLDGPRRTRRPLR
jgi:lysine 2,3-aminomutase